MQNVEGDDKNRIDAGADDRKAAAWNAGLYHHDFFSDHWVGNRCICDICYGGVLHWVLAERYRSPGVWNPGQPDRAPGNRQLYAEEA